MQVLDSLLESYEVESYPVGTSEDIKSKSVPYLEHVYYAISEKATVEYVDEIKTIADHIMTTYILH